MQYMATVIFMLTYTYSNLAASFLKVLLIINIEKFGIAQLHTLILAGGFTVIITKDIQRLTVRCQQILNI
jgi:hypothetical protein